MRANRLTPLFFTLLVAALLSAVLFAMLGFAEVPWEFISPTLLGIGAAVTGVALWALGYAIARGLEQTPPDQLTLAYFLVLTIVLPGASLLQLCVLSSLRVFGRPPVGLIMAMNIIPAFVAGWLFFTPFARRITQVNRQRAPSWRHFRRCSGLYLSALLLGISIVAWGRSPGFWLVGQLFLWSFFAVLGGIGADARQHRVWRHASGRDA
jgi:hypothetical protein